MARQGFGAFFRECRVRQGITLRAFCRQHGFDAANISRLERGQMQPPGSREKLEEYAVALGLEPDTDDWIEFFDRAAASSGRLPADLMSDEELLPKLPLVFRTLRGEKATREQLDALIERIRKA